MPSPVGHFLGGVAVGCLAGRGPSWPFLALCGVAAALPDIDFLLPMRHRGPSHGLGTAVLVGLFAFVAFRIMEGGRAAKRASLAIALAYATHTLFDWLGEDSSSPRGLMALWPLTSGYFISDFDVFHSVDRRYWLEGFWRRNTIALGRELAILLPLVGLAWWVARRKANRPIQSPTL
jgi:hypothetical protein